MLHTELFTQYIANNGGAESALPSLFDKIPSLTIDDEVTTFKDAFVLHFCDREIGFETEALFALKFEGRAKLVIPRYVRKLEELSKLDYINAQRTETETRTVIAKITDSGTDTMTHETSGTSTDGGTDTNKRFKGENPLIDTTLDFNAEAVSEQEQNATNYGKTNTTSGNGTDATNYGKTTDNTTTDTVTRKYTNDNIEVYEIYNRVLDDTENIWSEIFNEFDSLFMQVW